MLDELIRVTKPGGRIAAVVRSLDMPSWANAPLGDLVRAKVDRPGLVNGGKDPAGCADANLYQRFHAVGLTRLTCFPQFVSVTPAEVSRTTILKQRLLAAIDDGEGVELQTAVARAEADGTFFIASAHHCAVGTKAA